MSKVISIFWGIWLSINMVNNLVLFSLYVLHIYCHQPKSSPLPALGMIGITEMRLSDAFTMEQFGRIRPLLEQVVAVSSAPVERVFSQNGGSETQPSQNV